MSTSESSAIVHTRLVEGIMVGSVTSVLIVNSENVLAVWCGCADGSIYVWDVQTFTCVRHFKSGDDAINALIVGPSDTTVWAAAKNQIYAWDFKSYKSKKCLLAVDDADRSINCLLLVNDSYSLATDEMVVWGSSGHEVFVWTSDFQRIQELNLEMPVVQMSQIGPAVAVASKSSLLLVDIKSFSRIIRWDAHTQRITSIIVCNQLAFSSAKDKLVCVWDCANFIPGLPISSSKKKTSTSSSVRPTLVRALRRHKSKITDLCTAAPRREPQPVNPVSPRRRESHATPRNSTGQLLDPATLPHGVWSCGADGLLVLWDVYTLEPIFEFDRLPCKPVSIRALPSSDGHRLVAVPAAPASAQSAHTTPLLFLSTGDEQPAPLVKQRKHQFSEPIQSKPVRCGYCQEKIRDNMVFCLACEFCAHQACALAVRSACPGEVTHAPGGRKRLDSAVRAAGRSQSRSTSRIGASSASPSDGVASTSTEDFTNPPKPSEQSRASGLGHITHGEATVAALDFAARYLGTVRRLDANNMRTIHDSITSLIASPAVQSLYVGPPNARRIELRDIKRAVLKAIDPVKRRMAELPAETYRTPLEVDYAVYCQSVQSARDYMEDRYAIVEYPHELHGIANAPPTCYFAVFDGHEGALAAQYAATHLLPNVLHSDTYMSNPLAALEEGFIETDYAFNSIARERGFRDGTTAVCVLLRDDHLLCAWVGDSEALLCRAGKGIVLTTKHTPERSDEKRRVQEAGGSVAWHGTWRVNQSLAVTRSIGDSELSKLVIGDPDTLKFPLSTDDEWLMLGSDGLFDVFSKDELVNFAQRWLETHPRATLCNALVDEAQKRNSKDNVTCMVVFLAYHPGVSGSDSHHSTSHGDPKK